MSLCNEIYHSIHHTHTAVVNVSWEDYPTYSIVMRKDELTQGMCGKCGTSDSGTISIVGLLIDMNQPRCFE
jgi:hypothetical protein